MCACSWAGGCHRREESETECIEHHWRNFDHGQVVVTVSLLAHVPRQRGPFGLKATSPLFREMIDATLYSMKDD